MELFDRLGDEYEQIVICHEPAVGLRAVVAIHSTVLGPALGGTRYYPYRSEDQALEDVIRLARGMTYKSSVAGLDLGGGKAVILGDPATAKTPELLGAYGRFIESLGGRYITAEDVGTTQADMDVIFTETANVTGISGVHGGSGDPSAATAYGLWWGMKATRQVLDGTDELAGCRVVVSGVGKVGTFLVEHLVGDGAEVTVCDIDHRAIKRVVDRFGVAIVGVERAHTLDCDIFSPCALGATLDERVVAELKSRSVVGSANNQLATPADGARLADRGIAYAPDFVVNSGGVINISDELAGYDGGYDRDRAYRRVQSIYDTTLSVLQESQARGLPPHTVAEEMADRRLQTARASTPAIRCFDGTARRRPS